MVISQEFTRRMIVKAGIGGSLALAMPAIAQSRQISIISERNNAGTREALGEICAEFQSATGITVSLNNMDHEAHKTAIRNYLAASPPDVCFWFSGQRMRAFVKRGLFEDISDLVDRERLLSVLGPAADGVTVDGRQYGLPTQGTYWGMYYNKNVFEQYGLTAPKTFDDLTAMAAKAKKAGLIPFTIGTKSLWPAATWFDSFNLRINGFDKHMALMNGEISYLDPMLTPVFDHWEELIKADYYLPNQTSYSWQQSAAFLVQKKAAMIHLHQAVQWTFPEEERSSLRVVPFPEIVPDMPQFDDVSYNSVHVPSGAKNKNEAKEFLAFFYRPENLSRFIAPEGSISPRTDMQVNDTPLMRSVVEAMRPLKASSQFYDRDTDPDMAQAGINGFQEFMALPDRRDSIQQRLETTRKRVFGA